MSNEDERELSIEELQFVTGGVPIGNTPEEKLAFLKHQRDYFEKHQEQSTTNGIPNIPNNPMNNVPHQKKPSEETMKGARK